MLPKKVDIKKSTQFFHRYFGTFKKIIEDIHIFNDYSISLPLTSSYALQ